MADIKNKQNDPNLKTPSPNLDNGNNPKGVASLKETRKTNVSEAGTKFLRDSIKGYNR